MKIKTLFLNVYFLIVPIFVFGQADNYTIKLSESPFKFEVFKIGSVQPLLTIKDEISIQHFKNSKVYERKPYLVWEDGMSDAKRVIHKAKFIKNENDIFEY
jgi:hypothetical protein